MPELLRSYASSIAAWLVVGGAYLVQTLVADLAMVRAHHTAGISVGFACLLGLLVVGLIAL